VQELQADDAAAIWLKRWEAAVRPMKDLALRLRISPQSRQANNPIRPRVLDWRRLLRPGAIRPGLFLGRQHLRRDAIRSSCAVDSEACAAHSGERTCVVRASTYRDSPGSRTARCS
jgi:hypothetical protein